MLINIKTRRVIKIKVFTEKWKLTNSYVLRNKLFTESCWIELRAGRRKIVIATNATVVILIKIKKLLELDKEKLSPEGRSALTIPGTRLLKKKAKMQIPRVIINIWYPRMPWIILVFKPNDFCTAIAL